ncbi:MAG: mevalonate kinase [Chloroflexi bacterium]|nr:mevalonate kinase [Chloroflexota bacterium]
MAKTIAETQKESPEERSERVTIGRAVGKVILFGEHAVVYDRPAIAVPVTQVQAQARIEDGEDSLTLMAKDLGIEHRWGEPVPKEIEPLVALVEATLDKLSITAPPALRITLESTIPIARGLGSGAAVSTAVVRGLGQHFGHSLSSEEVSALVYGAERYYHGTPSGIDNTVIAYQKPIYFVKGKEPVVISLAQPLDLIIADSGVASPTKEVVQEVRTGWEKDMEKYERVFDGIEDLTSQARKAMISGSLLRVGELMGENHQLLVKLGVSSPLLDSLVEAARGAGAWGAKLSGAGKGGNAVALIRPGSEEAVAKSLEGAGAKSIIYTQVS